MPQFSIAVAVENNRATTIAQTTPRRQDAMVVLTGHIIFVSFWLFKVHMHIITLLQADFGPSPFHDMAHIKIASPVSPATTARKGKRGKRESESVREPLQYHASIA